MDSILKNPPQWLMNDPRMITKRYLIVVDKDSLADNLNLGLNNS